MQTTKNIDINAERSLLISELQKVEDISLLQAIKAVLHYGLKNEGRISLEQYNIELDETEARINGGEFFTQEEVEKMAKVVKKSKVVVSWDKRAYASLQRIFNYIKQDSPANAEKVRDGILKIVRNKFRKTMQASIGLLKNTHTGFPIVTRKTRLGFCVYVM